MKETSSGPRRWAFVVIAGGTLFSLPFVQNSEPEATSSNQSQSQLDILVPIPDKPTIAELPPISELLRAQDVIPSLTGDLAPGLVQTSDDGNGNASSAGPTAVDQQVTHVTAASTPSRDVRPIQQPRRASSDRAVESSPMQVDSVSSLPREKTTASNALPEWASANRSALDDLIDQSPRPARVCAGENIALATAASLDRRRVQLCSLESQETFSASTDSGLARIDPPAGNHPLAPVAHNRPRANSGAAVTHWANWPHRVGGRASRCRQA